MSRLFQNLNQNKTSWDIPIKLIKIVSEPLSIPFTYIYNQSIASGIVPDVFKISRVTPIIIITFLFISLVRLPILGTVDLLLHFLTLAKYLSD